MPERKSSTILDPYCPQCGLYKGVGECRNQSCSRDEETSAKRKRQRSRICVRCTEPVSIDCIRCRNGFCEVHSQNSKSSRIETFNMPIGTCAVCGQKVCESCWLVGDKGDIQCLEHWEDAK